MDEYNSNFQFNGNVAVSWSKIQPYIDDPSNKAIIATFKLFRNWSFINARQNELSIEVSETVI